MLPFGGGAVNVLALQRWLARIARWRDLDLTPEEAKDVAAEAIAQAWNDFERQTDIVDPDAWKVGAARAALPNCIRAMKRARERQAGLALALGRLSGRYASPEDRVVEQLAAVDLLNRIPDATTRQIVEMRSKDFSFDEIGVVLGITPTAAQKRVERLRSSITAAWLTEAGPP